MPKRTEKKFEEKFGGLKNDFYLRTPLLKRCDGKLTKSSLDNKTDVRYEAAEWFKSADIAEG